MDGALITEHNEMQEPVKTLKSHHSYCSRQLRAHIEICKTIHTSSAKSLVSTLASAIGFPCNLSLHLFASLYEICRRFDEPQQHISHGRLSSLKAQLRQVQPTIVTRMKLVESDHDRKSQTPRGDQDNQIHLQILCWRGETACEQFVR
jgi:hypothetical protein